MKKYLKTISILLFLLLFSLPLQALEFEHTEKAVFRVYDQQDNYIFSTARRITVGDRYISQDNHEYEIIELEEEKAIAQNLGAVDLTAGLATTSYATYLAQENNQEENNEQEHTVAIFHTHNGESFLPGPVNVEGAGDIHEVGQALASALEAEGINVLFSENMHLPHDGASYTRSRSTALELVRQGADIILDVHRDAIPDAGQYLHTFNGQEIVQMRLVVGRQNPNREVNDQFARHLKAISDEHAPGLVRDIFYGQGEYNQSLHPRSVLIEFGTHKNHKEQVVESTNLAASVFNVLLRDGEVTGQVGEGRAAWRNLFWILLIVIIGVTAYLYMLEGSWPGVWERVKNIFRREIIDRGGQ